MCEEIPDAVFCKTNQNAIGYVINVHQKELKMLVPESYEILH